MNEYQQPSNLPQLSSPEELQKQERNAIITGQQPVGMFVVKSANQTIQQAAKRPNPVKLWGSLWYEGEHCVLFGDSNCGKSIYAVMIAARIAESKNVLYFDFELSDKQFQLRYSDHEGRLHEFPPHLFRVEVNAEAMEVGKDFEAYVVNNIEQTALATGATVIIIDNITWLCNASEKAESAGTLMKAIIQMKMKYGWSVLILAHTPKRALTNPITQNDLAGSKRLFNLFDSAFAIGLSAKDSGLRYVKQLKIRSGELEYHSENVIVYEVLKTGAFLRFRRVGYSSEREHLREPDSKEKGAQRAAIMTLREEGKTFREIASQLGISIATISRILKK